MYKVLREGTGDSHPTADSSCSCHYAGTLIDGSEFDSSCTTPGNEYVVQILQFTPVFGTI